MSFQAAIADLADNLLDVFGEPLTVILDDSTEHAVRGIIDRARDDIESNVAAGWRYRVALKTETAQALGIAKRHTLTRGDDRFTVVDSVPDDGGMTTFILRREKSA